MLEEQNQFDLILFQTIVKHNIKCLKKQNQFDFILFQPIMLY